MVRPASTPYCVGESPSSGMSSGNARTTTTPRTAVKAMAEATSRPVAPMMGATAAMAELPQIELPQATSTAMRAGQPGGPAHAVACEQGQGDHTGDPEQEARSGSQDGAEVE